MFIRNCLTKRSELTVLEPGEKIRDALAKMSSHLSLPCIGENDQFLGLASKRTIFEAFQYAHSNGSTYESFCEEAIGTCLDTTVKTLSMDDSFEDTIDIIVRYPFVPIVEGDKFVGIVKRSDVNHALSVAFATGVESHRLLIGTIEAEGAFHTLFSITHRLGVPVITAVPFDAEDHALNRRIILKTAKTTKLKTLIDQLERAGFLVIEVKP